LWLFYDYNSEETPAMDDGTGWVEALLGLPGFGVIGVLETDRPTRSRGTTSDGAPIRTGDIASWT